MKLATNIHRVSGNCLKGFQSKGQKGHREVITCHFISHFPDEPKLANFLSSFCSNDTATHSEPMSQFHRRYLP